MQRLTYILASGLALAACSSLDEDVFPSITQASLVADPANGSTLAHLQIELHVAAGSRATHTIELASVFLETAANERVRDLALALPSGFDPSFDDDQERSAMLANIGTTNGELAPLCGTPLYLTAMLGYVDDEGTFTGSPPLPVSITCAP